MQNIMIYPTLRNTNGFKILVESKDGLPGGLRLVMTLGAFIKYPKTSFPQYKLKIYLKKIWGLSVRVNFFWRIDE